MAITGDQGDAVAVMVRLSVTTCSVFTEYDVEMGWPVWRELIAIRLNQERTRNSQKETEETENQVFEEDPLTLRGSLLPLFAPVQSPPVFEFNNSFQILSHCKCEPFLDSSVSSGAVHLPSRAASFGQ